jgi:hypothetical protein
LRSLLKQKDPEVCMDCHSGDAAKLQTTHLKPLTEIRSCLGCHQAHVTEKPGLLRNIKHSPFAKGDCKVCHE